MFYFSRWSTGLILGVIALAFLIVLPNFFSEERIEGWPSWLPRQQVVLGLDLQGGVYLLYEIDQEDYIQRRLTSLVGEVRQTLGEQPRVVYQGLGVQGDAVQVRLTDPTQIEEARERLEALQNPLTTALFSGSVNEFDLAIDDDGLVRMGYSDQGLTQRMQTLVQQSIEVIERRINALGTVEPSIQRQGDDRILVEVPGLVDPQRLKDLVGQTAQLSFHLVVSQQTIPMDQASDYRDPGTVVLPMAEDPTYGYLLDEEALVRGEDLIDAQTTVDQQTGEPVVQFRLNTTGARAFAEVTQNNVGRQFAIVLDDEVVSAPVINEPILGGSGVISGGSTGFAIEEANDLAIVLRAGALPAQLAVVEERTIGPSLGEDSIRAGITAAIVATLAIAVFMIVFYGLLGMFSVIALVAQNIIMLAVITWLGATLTLPGIAGIVLTMALAVDANVLIYERMREEAKAGLSAIAALDQGFRRALATIVDAHLTALIAAIALFWLGSGPIRGFAVTLGIGIVSTLFTAYLITRLIVAFWVRWARPKVVPL